MPDAHFAHPRLAAIYDSLDADRSDLVHYIAIADELDARSVLDVGCGTGTFACMLAAQGIHVWGVDPADASLAVARAKPRADDVKWHLGDATTLPPLRVGMATMTGNVAQVFVEDDDWLATLRGIHGSLSPTGHLVFEVRDPAFEGWKDWTPEQSYRRVDIPGVGAVATWVEVTDVSLPLVSFTSTYEFESDGAVLLSHSTLRFRERAEIERALDETGFTVLEVRDAPDRPNKEFVFVARVSDVDR